MPATTGKVALLAGPYELCSPEGASPEDGKVAAMAKAYALLGYDAGALTPAEATQLEKNGASMPGSFGVLGPAPSVTTIRIGDIPVGIVRFPDVPKGAQSISPDLTARTAEAAATLRGKVRLIIGLSGWGATDEAAFIRTHPGAVDVLLGSGPGLGSAGSAVADGKTLWSRAYTQGKTVNRLDIFSLPDSDAFIWKPQTGFHAEVISLDDHYAADPEIQKLF